MPETAKIAVSAAIYSIDRPYDYLVPREMEGQIQVGMRVTVPFGRGNRVCDGIVLSCSVATSDAGKLKPIHALLDQNPVLEQWEIQLALWMREQYFCTVYEAVRAMLPAGLWFSLQEIWKIPKGVDKAQVYEAAGSSKAAIRLADLLFAHGGSIEYGVLRDAFGVTDPGSAIRRLTEAGVLERETAATRSVKDKTEQMVALAMGPEEALSQVSGRQRRAPLQYQAILLLCQTGDVSAKELCYFTGASMSTLRSLEKQGLVTLYGREVYRRPALSDISEIPPAPVVLNSEQSKALEGLWSLTAKPEGAAALLYGVTGSGKTQVYIQFIHRLLDQGRTALVLVPEIALTPQLMSVFTAHFGSQVAILHSALSAGERYDEWKRVRNGSATVVVGTRSAVFAPLKNLGVIILDEEQEPTYKSEQTPRYHARDIARYRCSKAGALLLLGSATPSVETMYHSLEGRYHLFRLTQRFNRQEMPPVTIVDMRQQLQQGNGCSISDQLRQALQKTMERGEQSILFLNRRGANRMATCGECGESPTCPNCSVHLTYHSANGRLMCHYCGYSQPVPDHCPKCGGILNFVGVGTQKVEEELKALFPNREILRMDTDTVTASHSHEELLERFKTKRIPILVGTQMVAKGLDFENVTLVGVIAADQTLYVEDFRAGERTFSLLTQVVGRAGRGGKAGTAIIQTYTPENEVIQTAARQDYDSFYEREIQMRKLRGFPPFQDLLILHASGLEETRVLRACMRMREAFGLALRQPNYSGCQCRILGPAPAPVARVNHRYRYRLVLQTKNTKQIRILVAHVLRQAQSDPINRGISIFADINPLD